MLNRSYCFIFFFLLTGIFYLQGQDIEHVLESKPVSLSGGLNVSSGWYNVKGLEQRRDPYTWNLNANLNFNLFGVFDVPFSIMLNKGDRKLNRPTYSYYGISPKYKWITVHAGYRSMNFSSYTYSGLTFLGGGIEVEPPESVIKVSCFYGRFNKAIPVNFAQADITHVAYERFGMGTKIGFVKNGQSAEFIFFRAKDDIHSIHIDPDSVSDVKPKENLVFGINTSNQIGKRIHLKLEYAASFLTNDLSAVEKNTDKSTVNKLLSKLYNPRYSSISDHVLSGNISYTGNSYVLGISYKRVGPEYKSLGTSYSSNDLEDWMLNASKSFFENRINLSGSFGKQRNNLAEREESTNRRNIGSLMASVIPVERLNISLNYSNFNSNTSPTTIQVNDSVKFIQTTKNKGINLSYNTGKKNLKHSFSSTYNIQDANTLNQTTTESVSNDTKVKTVLFSYGLNIVPARLVINTSMSNTSFRQDTIISKTLGPTFGASRSFFKNKVNTNISLSFLKQENGSYQSSDVTVISLSASYTFFKKHSIGINNIISVNHTVQPEQSSRYREMRGSIRYSYSFSK